MKLLFLSFASIFLVILPLILGFNSPTTTLQASKLFCVGANGFDRSIIHLAGNGEARHYIPPGIDNGLGSSAWVKGHWALTSEGVLITQKSYTVLPSDDPESDNQNMARVIDSSLYVDLGRDGSLYRGNVSPSSRISETFGDGDFSCSDPSQNIVIARS
jgi:hypothetical protein